MSNSPTRPPHEHTEETANPGYAETADSFVAGSGGEGQQGTGASVTSRYHNREQDIVGVDVNDLKEFKSGSVEEFLQFVVGEFFAAGAFWLGIERIATVIEWYKDAVFWICVIAFIAGLVIGFFGYRQLARRQTRIDNIIAAAMRGRHDSGGT